MESTGFLPAEQKVTFLIAEPGTQAEVKSEGRKGRGRESCGCPVRVGELRDAAGREPVGCAGPGPQGGRESWHQPHQPESLINR